LFAHSYNRSDIQRVPSIIDIFDRGQAREMEREMSSLVDLWIERPDWGEALSLSIECAEEMPFTDAAAALDAYREFPLLRSLADGPPPFTACSAWPVRATGAEGRALIRSDVPALVLAGTFDPITPPKYGRQTAAALTNGWFVEFSSAGHDVLGNEPCAGRLASMFLDSPARAPNDPCVQELQPPRFLPPLE
jgi:pimeloyl-ACP methyl ester carboxylesterase